jgi:hypothetical protein
LERFPEDFMFKITRVELEDLRFQLNTSGIIPSLRLQIVTLNTQRGTNLKYLPYTFTEQGIAMLSGVLLSTKAIQMNIAIMRTFVALGAVLIKQNDITVQIKELKERIGEHDTQLNNIYDAMENLLDEKAA